MKRFFRKAQPKQETGNRKPEKGNRRREIGDRKPETGKIKISDCATKFLKLDEDHK